MDVADLTAQDQWLERFVRNRSADLVGREGLKFDDLEDLQQSANLALVERWRLFDPRRAKPTTFSARVVESHQASLLRKRRSLRRYWSRSINASAQVLAAIPDRRHQSQDLKLDLDAVVDSLPPGLQSICKSLQEHSPTRTAQLLGIHRTRVYEAVARIRRLFEDAGLRAYLPKSDNLQNDCVS
jgi:RNA polymerase sigma factor (sigma-70 family)